MKAKSTHKGAASAGGGGNSGGGGKASGSEKKRAYMAAKAAAEDAPPSYPPPLPPTAPPFVPTAMAANDDVQRVCLNCHSKDHIIFRCPDTCKLTNCPRNSDPSRPKHKARFCDLVTDRERFATLLKASPHCFILPNDDHPSNCVSSPPLSSFSSTSSDWGVNTPRIQIDCGSNINASPSSPFNLPARPPLASDRIEVANGEFTSVDKALLKFLLVLLFLICFYLKNSLKNLIV
jgi:hypothetical protein